ncbi:unnamed protein product [Prorocentrum cordatum]|uniref:Ion transport domain-containing protein n=1 Tax=Prorocentrum cordatum TaxID=2364126 RepID=A0ABN9VP41_9DINO|nr:unnamed protein product [Polarella glacialis]
MQFVIVHRDENARQVTAPCDIAQAYFRGWFWIDFVSVIPIDVYALWSRKKKLPGMTGLKAVRIVRLLRLVRLIRLAKFQRIASRWHTRAGISYSTISVCKFLILLLMVSHWNACIWGFTAMQQPCGEGWLQSVKDEVADEPCHRDPFNVYLLSLYWAVMTLTSVGYGDIVPLNTTEYIICTICMVCMAGLWAYVIGAACTVVATMRPSLNKFRQDVDDLNEFMEDFEMPSVLRKKMRMYFFESREVHRHRKEKAVISQLSPALQGEILLHLHKRWIKEVSYFSHSDDLFVVAAAQRLDICAFAQDEEVHMERTLFVVRKGICARASNTPFASELWRATHDKSGSASPSLGVGRHETLQDYGSESLVSSVGFENEEGLSYCERLWPRVYAPGSFWGEDMLLSNKSLRDEAVGRALTYLQVITLGVGNLIEIATRFPEVHASLCFARSKLALSRAIRKLSWHLRYIRADPERERTFVDLDDDQMRALIVDMLRGGSNAHYVLDPTADTSTKFVRKEAVSARSLSDPVPKQHSHVLGRIEHLQGQVARLHDAQDAISQKVDRVISAIGHRTNGRASKLLFA